MDLNFTIINPSDDITIEDYIKAIETNHAVAFKMKQEMVPIIIKTQQNTIKHDDNANNKENVSYTEEVDEKNIFFEDEVDFYLSMLDSIRDEDFICDEIEYALPSRNNTNYNNIISRICAEYLKQIKEIEELLFDERETLSSEELKEFKEEVSALNNRIEVIQKEKEEHKDNILESKTENNLIFVPTTGGNIKVLEEISSMADEYYDKFNELFKSIIDGTFKNVKRFKNNDKYTGLCEVRDFKVRVLFARIGKNDYALISAFIKKTDVDKAYTTRVEVSYKNFLNYKEELINNLPNPDFRLQNIEYKGELFEKLDRNNKKNKTKEKVDDTNGKNN